MLKAAYTSSLGASLPQLRKPVFRNGFLTEMLSAMLSAFSCKMYPDTLYVYKPVLRTAVPQVGVQIWSLSTPRSIDLEPTST